MVGYGYILLGVGENKNAPEDAYIILFFTISLILVCLKIVFDTGYAFRRDQLVIYRIFKKNILIQNSEGDKNEMSEIFPAYYNPLKKFYLKEGKIKMYNRGVIFLLPALHNTVALVLNVCIVFVFAAFIDKIKDIEWRIIIPAIIAFSGVSISIVLNKNRRLKKLYFPFLKQVE